MTAAFQGNAFQPNAFQMGSDPAPTETAVIQISDGNDAVMILHEQDQHTDHLGTVSVGQPRADAGVCIYPEADVISGVSSGTTINLPTPANGDLILVFTARSFSGVPGSVPSGWVQMDVGSNRLRTFYKVCDGTEGSTATLQPDGSASSYSYSVYRVKSGTYQGVPEGTFATPSAALTATPPTHAASWGSDYGLWFVAAGRSNDDVISGTPTDYNYAPVYISDAGTASTLGTRARQVISGSQSPSDWTFDSSSQTRVATIAIRGYCEPSETPVVESDTQDFTDTADYGSASGPVPDADEECLFPVVTSVTAGSDLTTGTSHVVSFTASVGDGVLVVLATNGNTHTATAGWTEIVDNESVVSYWRVIDGTEGGSMTITSSANSESVWYVYRIQAGTFDPSSTPSSAVSLNAVTQNPPNLNFGWTDKTLVLAAIAGDTATSPITFTSGPSNLTNGFVGQETGGTAVPDCYLAVGWGNVSGSSLDPNAFTITAQSTDYDLATIAIKGNCRVQKSIIDCDSQDWTDLADYGSYAAPLSEDGAAPAEDFLLGTGAGLDTQDFTDLEDYGAITPQPIPDNNPEVAPSSLDDQDFTDLADYGYVAAPLSDNNNPEVSLAAVALDTQDFTNLEDYGFIQNGIVDLDEQDPDLGQIDCDSQDFTDLEDYGSITPQAIEDNNPEIAPSSLDDQDFTDLEDYGSVVQQAIEDFVFREDFILGDGAGLDHQDWTDLEDYGSFTAPLSDDSVDFLLGTGDGLDVQDFTDEADYGYAAAPLSGDNNPEVAPSDLDTQDFTDLADYGSVTPQAIPDNNPVIAPSDLDTQDFTDTADYGYFNPQAIPDNNPELAPSDLDTQDFTDTADYGSIVQQAIEDNNPEIAPSSLDDQDFTDLTDYGSFTPQPNDEFIAPEDFILGDGKGLDDQDFTDTADYGYAAWLTPENVTEVYVNGVLITVSIGCYHIDAWQVIADPSTSWTNISDPTTLWNGIPDVSTVWSTPSDGSSDWTEIPNVSTTWTEDC